MMAKLEMILVWSLTLLGVLANAHLALRLVMVVLAILASTSTIIRNRHHVKEFLKQFFKK